MINQEFTLSLIPGGIARNIYIHQYDNGTRTLRMHLTNETSFAIPDGVTAYIRGTKPDGHGFSYNCQIIDSKLGIVSADVTRQMSAISGAVKAEIILEQSDGVILGTAVFFLMVSESALKDETVISSDDYKTIKQQVQEAKDAASRAEDSARRASDSQGSAALSESNAYINSRNAELFMDDARSSASSAQESKSEALKSSADAHASKEASSTSAINAASSAYYASKNANDASVSATLAAQSRDSALSSAKKAQQSESVTADNLVEIQKLMDSFYQVEIGPPLSILETAIVLPSPTLAMI